MQHEGRNIVYYIVRQKYFKLYIKKLKSYEENCKTIFSINSRLCFNSRIFFLFGR